MRRVISLLCLVGFYVTAVAGLLGLAVVGGMLLFLLAKVHALLIVPGGVALGLLVGTGFAAIALLREKPIEPTGIALYRDDAPELWSMLDELASAAGTRPPDQVWLSPFANAAVIEQPRWLGLRPGRRFLLLGFPLLQGMSLAQVRAVLAHEFGHYNHGDGRLTALGYRGHVAVGRMMERFPKRTLHPLSWLFRGYARLFFLVQRAASRRQELAADQLMARLAGRAAAQSALRMLSPLSAEWHRYLDTYVQAGFEADVAPENVFGGFALLLESRGTRLAGTDHVHTAPSRWDTHPPVAERLWALDSAPDLGSLPAAQNSPVYGCSPIQPGSRPVWKRPCSTSEPISGGRPGTRIHGKRPSPNCARQRPPAHRAIARVTGQRQGNLDAVLALSTAGDLDALTRLAAVQHNLAAAVLLAAHEAGSVHHVHTWDDEPDQPAFVRPNGSPPIWRAFSTTCSRAPPWARNGPVRH